MDSHYEAKRSDFADASHRSYVGGMWEDLGALQFDDLVGQGLRPSHRLLDIGCGSLRGGVRFIDYLDPFHYFGTDINADLIEAGRERELTPAQRDRLGPDSFRVSDTFDFNFDGPAFDFAIAFSLFTHLTQNKIRLCLSNLRHKLNGPLCATVFLSENTDVSQPQLQKDGIASWHFRDPYHYSRQQIADMARDTGWQVAQISDIAHPRNQWMVRFR